MKTYKITYRNKDGNIVFRLIKANSKKEAIRIFNYHPITSEELGINNLSDEATIWDLY